jgi:peptidyl-tRNA hydrolase
MGIGKPEQGNLIPIEDWVLSRVRDSELQILKDMLLKGEQAIRAINDFGFAKAQSLVNGDSGNKAVKI